MASQDGAQELVVVFDQSGSKPGLEMRYGQFKALLAQKATLEKYADSTLKAAYAQVGTGLTLRAVVFFLFRTNAEGYVDPAFNLPLDYMATHAGQGPDLGHGPIRMASRSQCPVPWHGINTWEPTGSGERHAAMLVQKVVWRNRLGLKPSVVVRHSQGFAADQQPAAGALVQSQRAGRAVPVVSEVPAKVSVDSAADGDSRASTLRMMRRRLQAALREPADSVADLPVEPGDSQSPGSADPQRLGEAALRIRGEMERQQQAYLEQIKNCRQEIQALKSALRHEQERNRRLQQLLRGDL